ncbi:HAD-like domain-containing protein [Scheffersomyces xylosifermentans]|uniref:HAD-like domain-containing protein n=1 Tax=Scheffersomyces xylosifermentans TaxID=1304137 RepID=UPI00315DA543
MTITLKTETLLFDLDGTLVNSIAAVEKSWESEVRAHNEKYPDNQYDVQEFVHSCHGSRTVDVFKKNFPYKPNDTEAVSKWEEGIVSHFGDLGQQVHGALEFLDSINKSKFKDHWAVVTSGTEALAHGWFKKLFFSTSEPTVFITANDVTHGKPNPEGYAAAYATLADKHGITKNDGVTPAVVFEDSPVGIESGVNAGFIVVGVATTFGKDKLTKAGAKYVVKDLSKVELDSSSKEDIVLKLDVL